MAESQAIEPIPEAATSVAITLTRSQKHVVCTVRDNGMGFRPEGAASRGGIGLAGIRTRLQVLDGTLAISSMPGEGATLTLSIPLVPNG